MIYTSKIKEAIRFSIKTHEIYQKQKRKGKDIPYIVHPLTVGIILAAAGAREHVIIAGILHDTIEDSVIDKKVTKEMLTGRFGVQVADLVGSVTEENTIESWHERKKHARDHIADFSEEALMLKSADVIANTSDLVHDHSKEGLATFERFGFPKEVFIGVYIDVIGEILKYSKSNPLVEDLEDILKALQSLTTPDVIL